VKIQMASLKVTGVALLICLDCGANAFRINACGMAPASRLSMRLDAERAPSRRPVWPALQRTVAPLLLSLLPALAPAIQGAYAEEGSAVVATTTDSGDSTGRLMGRIQPIDSLSGESEGLFKVSLEGGAVFTSAGMFGAKGCISLYTDDSEAPEPTVDPQSQTLTPSDL
jgi:hypothetical protein